VPDQKPPLGSIAVRGERYALGRDGVWRGPRPAVADELNAVFNPDEIPSASSAVVPAGYRVVEAAAAWAGDPAPELPRFPDSDEPAGTVH
jgi:hypothetical protein